MSQEEINLEKSIENNKKKSHWLGYLVVFGLLIELEIALLYPEYEYSFVNLGSILATLFVGAGVFGELQFGNRVSKAEENLRNKLRQESEIKIAEANQKAEEANLARLELEARLAPRQLSKEQYEALQTLKGKVSAVNVTSPSDFEAIRFAAQIAQALADAGIDTKICDQRIGMTWTEIYIAIPHDIPDFSKDPLFLAFKNAGISVGCGDRSHAPMKDLPENIPVVMVGEKALPRMKQPPYVFTLLRSNEEHLK